MSKIAITLHVNGYDHHLEVDPARTLLSVLRDDLGLTGTKENCLEAECGVCTALVDGLAVNTCIYPAVRAQGKTVVTIEGLSKGSNLHAMQQAFIDHDAVQCGYCIPGMILSAVALVNESPQPSDEAIRDGLVGNLCRCTGYATILAAVRDAAEKMAVNDD
jgi:carbon-monoxide dehydrogenase small subunit